MYISRKLGSEIGRSNSCQPEEGVTKLSEEASGRNVSDLELLELRIREKIGNEYGGLARTNWAAIVIQTAYRQYKLKKQYDNMCKKRRVLSKLGKEMPRRPKNCAAEQKHPMSISGEITAENISEPVVSTCICLEDVHGNTCAC